MNYNFYDSSWYAHANGLAGVSSL